MSNDYPRSVRAGSSAELYDAGLRSHLLQVYNYMAGGLALTGLTAYLTFLAAVTSDPSQAVAQLHGGLYLTQFGAVLFGPVMWLFVLGSFGLVMFLSFRIQHMSVGAAATSFLVYASLIGVTFASLFVVYTMTSIAQVFFITAITFGAMSLYGYTTGRDLSGMGSFLFMGLIGILIAMLVNFFMHSAAISFAISVIGVLIFTGLTAYDTQVIKSSYSASMDGTLRGRAAIIGALQLYLDFINLFLMLLRLLGDRR